MEFRRNIIFSIVAHATLAVIALALAGRNAALLRLPENYIAVSLFEYAEEKKSAYVDTIKKDSRNQQKRSQKAALSLRNPPIKDASHRNVSPKNEEIIPAQYPKNDPTNENEGEAVGERQYPDTADERTLREGHENQVSLQMESARSRMVPGENRQSSSSYGDQKIMLGNNMEMRTTESRPAGAGAGTNSPINQIRASIERAKRYPIIARKRRQEGSVLMEFFINTKGLPENIRIARSSGFALLDSEARNTIVKAAPFPVISGAVEVPITFRITDEK